MKKIIRNLALLAIFSLGATIPTNARNLLDYTIIGLIKDKRAEKGPKKKETNIAQVQQIATYEGEPMSMQQVLELGIVLTPELIEDLNSFGVDIPSKLNCEPFKEMSDPKYEWTQHDNKLGSVKMVPQGLMLTSKSQNLSALSVVDLDFDPTESPFEFALSFIKTKAEDNKYVGMVLDFENNNKFKAIVFSKKDYIYYTVEDGKISVVTQGLVKPGNLIETIYVKYEGSKMSVFLNGLDVATLTRVTLTSPICGIIVSGKRNAICDGFYFNVIETDGGQNQSTTDDDL